MIAARRLPFAMTVAVVAFALLAPIVAARAAEPPGVDDRGARLRPGHPTHRPARLVTGGPGYVGSSWGLGKPSYSGIGTRPDDGDAGVSPWK